MSEKNLEQRQVAILVGLNFINQGDFRYSMEELRDLAFACDIEVRGEITQNLKRPNISHYIGRGKLLEILALIEETRAKIVIFNDELSPSQIRNLEADLACKVIDRTVLILDIFAQRAKTREAKLQVEVAHLQYMLPRLIGFGESLGRQSGGVGTKNRGSGEKKLELDRRKIEEKIAGLNKELEMLVAQRQTQRKQRKREEVPVVSLVGYTNAGKSTIMNAMLEFLGQSAEKQVFEKDMLFATLETSVRSIHLPKNKSFLLTDTVGFISKLPHHLVKAFRSTLEEVREADLLIHVVDYSNPNFLKHIEVTEDTLKSIGVDNIPIIYAYNKSDLVGMDKPKMDGNCLYLSAKEKMGLEELVQVIDDKIAKNYVWCQMLIPYNQGAIVSYLNQNAVIKETKYETDGAKITLECRVKDFQRYQNYVVKE